VTMRNIMQHAAGFEEQVKNIITEDPTQPGYIDLLKRWTPTRVFDAGTTPAYSNYATSVAGYVVERVSGESFYDYVEKHIFAPLDMKHSSMRQPLPKELEPHMATGYVLASGEAKKFEIVGPAPAGSLSAPGEDMAHFMIAHLQNGEYNGNRILKEETAKQMHDSPLTLQAIVAFAAHVTSASNLASQPGTAARFGGCLALRERRAGPCPHQSINQRRGHHHLGGDAGDHEQPAHVRHTQAAWCEEVDLERRVHEQRQRDSRHVAHVAQGLRVQREVGGHRDQPAGRGKKAQSLDDQDCSDRAGYRRRQYEPGQMREHSQCEQRTEQEIGALRIARTGGHRDYAE